MIHVIFQWNCTKSSNWSVLQIYLSIGKDEEQWNYRLRDKEKNSSSDDKQNIWASSFQLSTDKPIDVLCSEMDTIFIEENSQNRL